LASDLETALAGLKTVVEAQENMHAYRVQRSVLIEAPDVLVLAEIMDFREWNKWFPREQLDPGLKRVFSGTDSQPGSTYHWAGNDRVGSGRVSMISSSAEKIEIEVGVEKPIDSLSDVVFTLAADGKETLLVCVVSGEKDPSGQAVTLLGSTPESIGAELQQGLAKLKELAAATVPRGGGNGPQRPAARNKPVLEILADSIVIRRAAGPPVGDTGGPFFVIGPLLAPCDPPRSSPAR
ncbi:MAG: SRPBCC family protein, partial [Myxococcales bacterium]